MSGIKSIYITALITTVLAVLMIGGIIWRGTNRQQRPLLLLFFTLELPMCALAYYYVREPYLRGVWSWLALHLDHNLTVATVKQSNLYGILRIVEAPLAEELSKLWPLLLLLIPRVYQYYKDNITPQSKSVLVAMSLGLGFGVGELWFVAHLVAQNPAYSELHWYSFGGFLNERFMVCICHCAFTAVTVYQIGKGVPRVLLGLLGSMTLHFIGNFPIFLMKTNVLHLGPTKWTTIVALYTVIYFLLMILLLTRLTYGNFKLGKFLFGRAKCPSCKQIYDRPFFGLNAYPKRYEKCTQCRKYNWIDERHDLIKDSPSPPADPKAEPPAATP